MYQSNFETGQSSFYMVGEPTSYTTADTTSDEQLMLQDFVGDFAATDPVPPPMPGKCNWDRSCNGFSLLECEGLKRTNEKRKLHRNG